MKKVNYLIFIVLLIIIGINEVRAYDEACIYEVDYSDKHQATVVVHREYNNSNKVDVFVDQTISIGTSIFEKEEFLIYRHYDRESLIDTKDNIDYKNDNSSYWFDKNGDCYNKIFYDYEGSATNVTKIIIDKVDYNHSKYDDYVQSKNVTSVGQNQSLSSIYKKLPLGLEIPDYLDEYKSLIRDVNFKINEEEYNTDIQIVFYYNKNGIVTYQINIKWNDVWLDFLTWASSSKGYPTMILKGITYTDIVNIFKNDNSDKFNDYEIYITINDEGDNIWYLADKTKLTSDEKELLEEEDRKDDHLRERILLCNYEYKADNGRIPMEVVYYPYDNQYSLLAYKTTDSIYIDFWSKKNVKFSELNENITNQSQKMDFKNGCPETISFYNYNPIQHGLEHIWTFITGGLSSGIAPLCYSNSALDDCNTETTWGGDEKYHRVLSIYLQDSYLTELVPLTQEIENNINSSSSIFEDAIYSNDEIIDEEVKGHFEELFDPLLDYYKIKAGTQAPPFLTNNTTFTEEIVKVINAINYEFEKIEANINSTYEDQELEKYLGNMVNYQQKLMYYVNILIGETVDSNLPVYSCSSLLGEHDNPNDPAYWFQLVFDVMKYIGIAALFGLSTLDFVKAVASHDSDALAKALKTSGIRLIYTVILFFFPMILKYIFQLVGIYTNGFDPYCGLDI